MKLIAKEILMAGCKNLPFVGPVIDVVDNIHKSHETLHMQSRLDQIENNLSSFERRMRDLVQGEIETTIAALSRRDLDGADFTSHIKHLYHIQQNGWSPALFQGLLERSVHWDELCKNPSHYGNVLSDRDTLDASKLPIFIDADKTRVLELTPFALHSLLARQIDESPQTNIVTGADVWAFVGRDGETVGAVPSTATATAGKVSHPNTNVTDAIGMEFAWIPPGHFRMGSDHEFDRKNDETPHTVHLRKGFFLGVQLVTQEQWTANMGSNPSMFRGRMLPVEQVSWYDAIAFCNAQSAHQQRSPYYHIDRENVTILGGDGYRLTSEAEWEYACRAGSTGAYCFGDDFQKLGDYAWYANNSSGRTHSVGQKKPNAWGLYDMHGHIFEWCWDWYGDYPTGEITDPHGPVNGSCRVVRGGTPSIYFGFMRSAARHWILPSRSFGTVGLRVCRNAT